MMKSVAMWLMIIAGIVGLIAAFHWLRSATVPISPLDDNEPADEIAQINYWKTGIIISIHKSASLNRIAAALTGISVLLGSIAGIVGTIP